MQNVTTFYCPKQLQSIHLNCLQCNSHTRIDTISVQLVSVGLPWWIMEGIEGNEVRRELICPF